MICNLGSVEARFVFGSISRRISERISTSLLDPSGISVLEDITVDTQSCHWSIGYFPATGEIDVDSKIHKKMLIFQMNTIK